jgi:lactate dehydrogenase-like 2-hydroxyacid dehydrogenase
MTAKNILITRRIPEIGIKKLLEKGYVVDIGGSSDPISQKDLIKLLKKKPYDGVISLLTDKIDGVVFNSAPSVKIFANYAVGFDNFDVNEAKQRGVMLTNIPGVYNGRGRNKTCDLVNMTIGVVILKTMPEPDQRLRTQESADALLDLFLCHLRVSVCIQKRLFGCKNNTRTVSVDGATFQDEPGIFLRVYV